MGVESGGNGDGAADAGAGYETDDGGIEGRVGRGEVGAFKAEGGLVDGRYAVVCLAA